jgi:galactoside 2-L-fucosyltransferase 1/2
LKLTSTRSQILSSPTTTINQDEILCDNITEFKRLNTSQNPCERLRCTVILHSSGGRLGNRMFMFASAYGLARVHNCRLHISESILQELANHFQIKPIEKNMWLSQTELSHVKDIQNKDTVCSFLPELLRPNAFHNIQLTGYWQSYLYFDAYREEIREFFIARTDTLIRLAAYLTNIIHSTCPLCLPLPNTTHQELRQAFRTRYNITWISIHIRLSDFRHLGYSSDNDYIRRAILFYQRRYYQYQIRFLVASDDRSYCRELFASEQRSGKIIILPDHFSPADDLMALSLCHHSIVTGGTFGFWSAYLAGGEVIHDVRYKAGCLRSDYYPPWFMLVGSVVEKKA